MKHQNDMDWELFEMLEGDLTPQEESELLEKMEEDAGLASDWDFMQMTQLDAPDVVYTGKSKLIKKDTTLIAFSAIQWKRVAAVAAVLAICYPMWQLIMPKTEDVEGLAGSATELVEPQKNTSNEGAPTIAGDEVENMAAESPVVEASPNTVAPKPRVKQVKQPNIDPIETNQPKEQLVSIAAANRPIELNIDAEPLNQLDKANVMYNMHLLIPRDETPEFKGVRHTVNAGLALMAAPFKNTKIKVQPADNRAIQIIYSSDQYKATAMVSLKPLK